MGLINLGLNFGIFWRQLKFNFYLIMTYDEMIIAIANLTHEKFFDIYQKKDNGSRIKTTTDEAWIEKNGTDQVDVAKLDYSDLPQDWQKSRWLGAKAALDALLETIKAGKPLDDKFIECASDIVHEEWLTRNSDKITEEGQYKLSYDQLSEDGKEKDRVFVRAAIEVYQKSRKE